MKKLLMATAALAVLGTSAFAADLPRPMAPVYKAPAMVPAPVYSWTGCYIGGNVGGIFERNNTPIGVFDGGSGAGAAAAAGAIPTQFSYDRSSWLAGGQLGCNYQYTNWVFGIETDFQGTDLNGRETINTAVAGFFPTTSTVTQKMDWIGTTRGRIGFLATPSVLLYGTGGAAYAGVKDTYSLSNVAGGGPVSTFGSDSSTRFGWTAGGGVEVAFGAWSVKGEALYYDLGNHTLNVTCTIASGAACAGAAPTVFSARYQDHGVIARAGLNYHFNTIAP